MYKSFYKSLYKSFYKSLYKSFYKYKSLYQSAPTKIEVEKQGGGGWTILYLGARCEDAVLVSLDGVELGVAAQV